MVSGVAEGIQTMTQDEKMQAMSNLNEASLMLANLRARMSPKWALKGSIVERGQEVLEHAQRYLSSQCEDIGATL